MNIETTKKAILQGKRRTLAQAITLIESTRPDHFEKCFQLLQEIFPYTGNALRIGVSGAPGVGKSTFIESLGLYAIKQGKRIAVLAIDPSSPKSHGSILGDKTRMVQLASNPNAFIRPSPSGEILGGVSKHTRETILLCEAAGFDLIIVETVGVGQLEADVVGMVDLTLLLLPPVGGDHIQGMKKGMLELVDMIIVNKADGDLKTLAYQMAKEFMQAFKLTPKCPYQKIMLCSALEHYNIDKVYENLLALEGTLRTNGLLEKHRQEQYLAWFWQKVDHYLLENFKSDPNIVKKTSKLRKKILNQSLLPSLAAYALVNTD